MRMGHGMPCPYPYSETTFERPCLKTVILRSAAIEESKIVDVAPQLAEPKLTILDPSLRSG